MLPIINIKGNILVCLMISSKSEAMHCRVKTMLTDKELLFSGRVDIKKDIKQIG